MANGTLALLDLARTAQALALTKENLRLAKQKKTKVKDFVGVGVKNIVGIDLIRAQANLAAQL